MRFKDEEGQAVILLALAMSIFLIGAIGMAVDGSNLYAQRQLAQAAADSAAQAGIMSIFDGTNSVSGNAAGFTAGTAFTCTTTDKRTPCVFANQNGFGGASTDTVGVTFPTSAPGVNLSPSDPTNLIQVSVSRSVNTTLMRLLGPTATTVTATATAGIVSVVSPVPMLITDPTNSNTLSMNGTTSIAICGGPIKSIQVNSSSATAFGGGGSVDLSHGGPADSGNCQTGTGANFAVTGGSATNPGSVNLGSTGTYLSKQSPIQDPLANVSAPSVPTTIGSSKSITAPTDGCISGTCTEYSPGLWVNGISIKNDTVIFKPGIYYMQGGGFTMKNASGGGANNSVMCVGCLADASTGTGMLVYDTGPAGSTVNNNPAKGFTLDTGVNAAFQGPTITTHNAQGVSGCPNLNGCDVPTAPYFGVLFWEDRTADANTDTLGAGNGCFSLVGTVYITNTLSIMLADSNHHQVVNYHGTPCSGTVNQGEIIVSQLSLKGNVSVSMGLFPYGFLQVRSVALVN